MQKNHQALNEGKKRGGGKSRRQKFSTAKEEKKEGGGGGQVEFSKKRRRGSREKPNLEHLDRMWINILRKKRFGDESLGKGIPTSLKQRRGNVGGGREKKKGQSQSGGGGGGGCGDGRHMGDPG